MAMRDRDRARRSSPAHAPCGPVLFAGAPQAGVVVRLLGEKGFGFMRLADGNEVFFHKSGTVGFDDLAEGDAVVGKLTQGPKGLRAFDVQLA